MKEIGTEIKIETNRNSTISLSTLNKHSPKAMTLKYKSKITIREGMIDEDYKKAVRRINKAIRQYLSNTLDRDIFLTSRTLVLCRIPTVNMNTIKGTFGSVEITLFQKGTLLLKSNPIQYEINRAVANMGVIFSKDKVFKFRKTK